jgi:hypothetical protein
VEWEKLAENIVNYRLNGPFEGNSLKSASIGAYQQGSLLSEYQMQTHWIIRQYIRSICRKNGERFETNRE